jgi:hypothetical protein
MIKILKEYLANNQHRYLQTTSYFKLIKYYFEWLNLQKKGRNPLDDEQAWITFEARDYLNNIIKPNMRVFEFGSGGSSLYFAKNVSELISVEHNAEWFSMVQKRTQINKIENFTGFLKPPVLMDSIIVNPNYANPDTYLSSDENYANQYSFFDYATSIDKFPDEYFDIVSVDGRARPSCLKHCFSKIKQHGYLMLDNSDRKYYTELLQIELQAFEKVFEKFGPGPYNKGFWATSFYKKKSQ